MSCYFIYDVSIEVDVNLIQNLDSQAFVCARCPCSSVQISSALCLSCVKLSSWLKYGFEVMGHRIISEVEVKLETLQ